MKYLRSWVGSALLFGGRKLVLAMPSPQPVSQPVLCTHTHMHQFDTTAHEAASDAGAEQLRPRFQTSESLQVVNGRYISTRILQEACPALETALLQLVTGGVGALELCAHGRRLAGGVHLPLLCEGIVKVVGAWSKVHSPAPRDSSYRCSRCFNTTGHLVTCRQSCTKAGRPHSHAWQSSASCTASQFVHCLLWIASYCIAMQHRMASCRLYACAVGGALRIYVFSHE